MFGTLYNTNININGRTVYRSSYNSLGWGCGGFGLRSFGGFSPGCFGFGYCNPYDSFKFGAGIGLGFAAGMTLMPAMPAIFKGIGKGCSFIWNKGIKPVVQWVGKGIKNTWNWIFGKKNKAKKAE